MSGSFAGTAPETAPRSASLGPRAPATELTRQCRQTLVLEALQGLLPAAKPSISKLLTSSWGRLRVQAGTPVASKARYAYLESLPASCEVRGLAPSVLFAVHVLPTWPGRSHCRKFSVRGSLSAYWSSTYRDARNLNLRT